jgi:hypothetical protein
VPGSSLPRPADPAPAPSVAEPVQPAPAAETVPAAG